MDALVMSIGLLGLGIVIALGYYLSWRACAEIEAWAIREVDLRTRMADIQAARAEALRVIDDIADETVRALREARR